MLRNILLSGVLLLFSVSLMAMIPDESEGQCKAPSLLETMMPIFHKGFLKEIELLASKMPHHPVNDLKIIEKTYKGNEETATYCKRDPNVADTIVIHHTATGTSVTPDAINNMHLQNHTNGDPWFMIGYNFVVKQASYTSNNIDVYRGRPIDMSGSHAGGFIKPSKELLEKINTTDVTCGSDKEGFTTDKLSIKLIDGKINANHTTIGVSIIGNYSPKVYRRVGGVVVVENETGYEPNGPKRYPSDSVLRETAKLICQLQKEYPGLKKIKPHQFFRDTNCPGNAVHRLDRLRKFAKEYSCDFSL